MEKWEISQDVLKTIRTIAHAWSQGVVILKPFNGDYVILAVNRVDWYSPSNNIHHSVVIGKDITLAVQQKLNIANPQGGSPVITYIDNIKEEQTWEIPHNETFYWIKVRDAF